MAASDVLENVRKMALEALEVSDLEGKNKMLASILEAVQGKGAPLEAKIDEIYALYPRKVGGRAAKLSIMRAIKRGAEPEFLLGRVAAYSKAKDGYDITLIPHPTTWFNQERYYDDESEWNAWKQADASAGGRGKRIIARPETSDDLFFRREEDRPDISSREF